jgi:P-aminobenzoate N-oxygenase AurF
MLAHAQAGIALQRIVLELTASRLRHARESAEYAYLLHEMREEAGHSLMFLKLAAASGLTLPGWQFVLPRSTRLTARALPSGALYWAMLVIGEDIPDKLNRFVRRQASASLAPLIRQMITLQMVNEARHIAYARQRLDAATSGCGAIAARVYGALLDRLFNQFIHGYFWPRAELYECAGLGEGRAWRRLAMRNPHRREFVLRLSAPTMRLLASRGITIKLR